MKKKKDQEQELLELRLLEPEELPHLTKKKNKDQDKSLEESQEIEDQPPDNLLLLMLTVNSSMTLKTPFKSLLKAQTMLILTLTNSTNLLLHRDNKLLKKSANGFKQERQSTKTTLLLSNSKLKTLTSLHSILTATETSSTLISSSPTKPRLLPTGKLPLLLTDHSDKKSELVSNNSSDQSNNNSKVSHRKRDLILLLLETPLELPGLKLLLTSELPET